MTRFARVMMAAALVCAAAPVWAHPAQSAIARARAAEAKGNLSDALLTIQAEIVAHPAEPENYVALADLYARNGHPDAARKYYDDALFIDPLQKDALKGMALADLALGDAAAAQASLDRLQESCGPRCPETMAVREALEKSKNPVADASSAPLDKP